MKKYSELFKDEQEQVLLHWYEGCFSYMMRNLEDFVGDIYDVDEVEATLEGQVETEVEITLTSDDYKYGDFEIDYVEGFKKDMLNYLMGVYEEMYLDKD